MPRLVWTEEERGAVWTSTDNPDSPQFFYRIEFMPDQKYHVMVHRAKPLGDPGTYFDSYDLFDDAKRKCQEHWDCVH